MSTQSAPAAQNNKGLGLLTVLQTELRSISQEARTKYQTIKEASERGILKLKYIEEQTSNDKLMQELSKSEDVLRPFLMACDTKNSKMVSIAIGAILKLISQSAVSLTTLPLILAKMAMLIDVASEEQVQLKVLQGLLILITTLNGIHEDLLSQCLVLCFRLHSSKNTSIQHTSSATLPQIIRILFDRVKMELNQTDESISNSMPPLESMLASTVNEITSSGISSPLPQSTDQQQQTETNNTNNNEENTNNETTTTTSNSEGQQDNEPINSNNNNNSTGGSEGNSTTTSIQNSPLLNGRSNEVHVGDRVNVPVTLKPCARDAYLLLEDLCHITGGDNPTWLPPTTTIARSSGLELIEMIISSNQQIFTQMEEFKFLLKDRVCPLLIKSFKFKMDFFHTVRLMRIITQFISKYSDIMVTESDVLLTKSIRMLEGDNPLWMQIISLESIKTYTEDPSLLRMFYRNYDKDNNAAKIFENISSSIGKYVQNLYNLESSNYTFVNTSKNRCMDLLNRDEPPNVKDNYIISVCMECITGIVNAVSEINNPELNGESELFRQMANSCWVSILGAISMLLSKAHDETLIQIVLKSLQSFTNTCGELRLSAPRDALLTCLCKTTMPPSLGQYDQSQTLSPQSSSLNSSGGNSGSGLHSSSSASNLKDLVSSSGSSKQDKEKDDGNDRDDISTIQASITIKNILSLKTLLNIAHCMGSVLDETWLLILETLEVWDRLLKTMHQSAQQDDRLPPPASSSGSGSSGTSRIGQGEISILITAMNSLFKSSNQLDEKSIGYLFDALGKLCTNALSKSNFINSPTSMFSISKLVEASMANLNRIDKLWGYISQHLSETGNFKNPYVRAYGVDSLTQIIKGALNLSAPPINLSEDQTPQDSPSNSNTTNNSNTNTNDGDYSPTSTKKYRKWNIEQMQIEFFLTIEELTFSQFADTKEKILESLHQILHSSGQVLTTSWPILLSILLRVSQNNEKQFILVSFESLKLICNEFLSNLTPECLVLTIEVISAFVSQKSDINISLTASSGLLSDLTYFLANENALANSKFQNQDTTTELKQESIFNLSPKVSTRIRPGIPTNSPYYLEKDRDLMSRMWLCSFTSMKTLCLDPRPAIRNGVIVSLFQTLTTFLHLLDKDLIDLILWRILFPLIEEVKQCSETADKERIDPDIGGGLKLLVHHSRNTAQKQWDETQVLPIGRMIIVFKTFFDTLITLPSFSKAWEKLLLILETESKSSSKEVSMASISSLHEIVNSNITDSSHPELVESVWETLLRLSSKLTDPSNAFIKTLSIYIKVFLDLYQKSKPTMDNNQMLRVLQILYPLGLNLGETVSELSSPQVHTLQLLKSLPPVNEEIFPILITLLLKYISVGINYTYAPTHNTVIFPNIPVVKDMLFYAPITEKSIELVCELFTHPTTTNPMRALIYEDILKVFGTAMLTKYTKYHSNIWKISTSSLIKLLPLGLLSINQDSNYLNDIKRNMIWSELIDTIHTFILHERTVSNTTLSPEKKSEEEKFDIELVNAISKEMVGFSGIKVERVSIIRDRLVEILCEGSSLSHGGREKVSQACYSNMFSICAKASLENPESIEIAKIILPVLLKRCKEVLQKFVMDEKQSGQFPLPRHRLSEVSFILKEIKNLELQPGIYRPVSVKSDNNNNEEESSADNNNSKKQQSKRPHLLDLYVILSDCICTSEKEIKELLKNIFYLIATEFLNLNLNQ